MSINDITDSDPGSKDEDGRVDWAEVEEELGRDAVEAELDPFDPDPALEAYLDETDTSCSNEELGLDEHGNREDD